MKNKQLNKDLSSMSRDESEQNIIELTTQVESQKQKIQWLQEQFDLLADGVRKALDMEAIYRSLG